MTHIIYSISVEAEEIVYCLYIYELISKALTVIWNIIN